MTKNEFLDRYIQGRLGNWFFEVELTRGRCIEGGYFDLKQDARDALLDEIIILFGDGEAFFRPTKKLKKA